MDTFFVSQTKKMGVFSYEIVWKKETDQTDAAKTWAVRAKGTIVWRYLGNKNISWQNPKTKTKNLSYTLKLESLIKKFLVAGFWEKLSNITWKTKKPINIIHNMSYRLWYKKLITWRIVIFHGHLLFNSPTIVCLLAVWSNTFRSSLVINDAVYREKLMKTYFQKQTCRLLIWFHYPKFLCKVSHLGA